MAVDESLGGGQSAIEIERSQQGFEGIGQQGWIVTAAAVFLAPGELQQRADFEPGRDVGQGPAAHQDGKAFRQRPLLLIRKILEQHMGDNQAEHPVAEEFEPLEASPPRLGAGVGQSLDEQFRTTEFVIENTRRLGEAGCGLLVHSTILKIRPNRVAVGHFHNSQIRALPLVEKKMISARPTRFSAGIKPTPR